MNSKNSKKIILLWWAAITITLLAGCAHHPLPVVNQGNGFEKITPNKQTYQKPVLNKNDKKELNSLINQIIKTK